MGDPLIVLASAGLVAHRSPIAADQIRTLVDAGADAGFAGMSIWTAHADWAQEDGAGPDAFFDWHRERGLTMPVAEVLLDWVGTDPRAIARSCAHVLDVAARAGASSVIAATLDPAPPLDGAVAGLRALCDLAADRGLRISFEFLPWTGVATIADAVRLIDAVQRDNLGLVIDAWHWFRQPGGPDVPTLRALAPERIHVLQLNDAPAWPAADLPTETSTARLLPGTGAIDLRELVDVVAGTGASPVIVCEVFSVQLAEAGAAENARRQFAATQAVLAGR
jgi:sugar phosphate isomerase/epimerase